MNKVNINGDWRPSLGPFYCFARLILSFTLHLANLYEVAIILKCEGDDKGLQALFVFLH